MSSQSVSPAPERSDRRGDSALDRATYEVLRQRLDTSARDLAGRIERLNGERKALFGSIELALRSTVRVTTEHNCVPRDLVCLGDRVLLGFEVSFGLKAQTNLEDVFALYRVVEDRLEPTSLEWVRDARFESDFQEIFRYYKKARFVRFARRGPFLFMVFRLGESVTDIKVLKWAVDGDALRYVDNRSEHEFRYPLQHDFDWVRAHRDHQRSGVHPHISIEDRLFVETVGGDLTVKVEDNTESGEGIYSEPVQEPDQTLDDAEVFHASIGHLIFLKIRPYQEKAFRYLVYNEKLKEVQRIDTIETSCVVLPDDQGIIFSNGYYLQGGDLKLFDSELRDMMFEARIPAPNGEDHLYVFYNRLAGIYVLLSYNMIEQSVGVPIVCHGYSFFDSGELLIFRDGGEPQRHHPIQRWTTPYQSDSVAPPAAGDTLLEKVGNRDLVRGMSEGRELIRLIRRDDNYEGVYVELAKRAGDLLDSYFWLEQDEAHRLAEPIREILEAATAAIDEYEKVVELQRIARERTGALVRATGAARGEIQRRRFEAIPEFVDSLGELRRLRGQANGLREVRYVQTEEIDRLEEELVGEIDALAQRCVTFLLEPAALEPYRQQVEAVDGSISEIATVVAARETEGEIDAVAEGLELLIETVSNLAIDDARQRTQIVEDISEVFARLNRTRAALEKRTRELRSVEGAAEFGSQLRLLEQSTINFLDLADTPEKCDDLLSRMMVQLEELEAKFADFDEYVDELAENRQSIYDAFESRKVQLIERRNQRAAALLRTGERLLTSIATRLGTFGAAEEIHTYLASDVMVEKIRNLVRDLTQLGDSVKASDLEARLKSIRETSLRQLADRQELFVDGAEVVRLGRKTFTVNTQPLDLTVVPREGEMFFHLTGTGYFRRIDDPRFLEFRDVWEQEFVSETPDVYRAEYLAYRFAESLTDEERAAEAEADDWTSRLHDFMGPRYREGYVKGVHDHDAARILARWFAIEREQGLLRFSPTARVVAQAFWEGGIEPEERAAMGQRLAAAGRAARHFGRARRRRPEVASFEAKIRDFRSRAMPEIDAGGELDAESAEFLVDVLRQGGGFPISPDARALARDFRAALVDRAIDEEFRSSLDEAGASTVARRGVAREWLHGFVDSPRESGGDSPRESYHDALEEAAALLASAEDDSAAPGSTGGSASLDSTIFDLRGRHPLFDSAPYRLHVPRFLQRLRHHVRHRVPRFEEFQRLKRELVERERERLRLEEFRPRVLSSFVRNRLLDQCYLPLIGDNLAKQIGVAGAETRTDRMGLLLLVSPPGYGKTTLMEYIASRLGLTFVKVNGPAIGHAVTSLDPTEAPHASARQEIERLNLALEMGDNVMIYLDDIQHTHPELLQKFISLCDGQRKMEGVFDGRPRTYDLRGKKVAVVMAGNPYTESGEKFRIPDMLANRADTYNLGEVIGPHEAVFELSYIENSLTSNPLLNELVARHRADLHALIRRLETDGRDAPELVGSYSPQQLEDIARVLRHLFRVRDVILTVNREYVRSAAQADDYRTEPPFKLQGSYRNMNKLAERVLPIQTEAEVEALIWSHYESESQTLTRDTEANLLKLGDLLGRLDDDHRERWAAIRQTFVQNNRVRGLGGDEAWAQLLLELQTFGELLGGIRDGITQGVAERAGPAPDPSELVRALTERATTPSLPPIRVINKVPRSFLNVIQQQFAVLESWLVPLAALFEASDDPRFKTMSRVLAKTRVDYEHLLDRLEHSPGDEETVAPGGPDDEE